MYNETKATTLNGYVQLEGTTVVSMFAQKSSKGDVSVNINIQSETLYQAHKEECDTNIETFKAHVEEL